MRKRSSPRLHDEEYKKFDSAAFNAKRRSLMMPNLLALKEAGLLQGGLPSPLQSSARPVIQTSGKQFQLSETSMKRLSNLPPLSPRRASPRVGSHPNLDQGSPLFARKSPRERLTMKELAVHIKEDEAIPVRARRNEGIRRTIRLSPVSESLLQTSQEQLSPRLPGSPRHQRAMTETADEILESPSPRLQRLSPRGGKWDVTKHIHNMHYANQRAVQTYILDELATMQARVQRVLSEFTADAEI